MQAFAPIPFKAYLWLSLFLIVTYFGLAIWLRTSLWPMGRYSLLTRALPHIPAWYLVVVVFIYDNSILPFSDFEKFWLTPFALMVLVYWLLQGLRHSVVADLPGKRSHQSDSIQSKVAHYMDVHGLSARLAISVNRSDGGVFGVTGVRGAGKSALTRHLLSNLEPNYFTLEVTSPVHHDHDMGFLIALCQAVCRKTMDDLEPILFGVQGKSTGKLWEKIRNPAMMGLILLAVLSAISLLPSLEGVLLQSKSDKIVNKMSHQENWTQDPFLKSEWKRIPESLPFKAEREIVDHLISQIDLTVEDPGGHKTLHYLLVPSAQTISPRFWLLGQSPGTDEQIHNRLLAYCYRLNEAGISTHPSVFLFRTLSPREQNNWLRLSEHSQGPMDLVSKGSLPKWEEQIRQILDKSRLTVPLSHLVYEFSFHLRTLANPQPENNHVPDTRTAAGGNSVAFLKAPACSESPLEPQLVSSFLLESFRNGDARLSFNEARLQQFRQTLEAYRYLLDGEVAPRPQKEPASKFRISAVFMLNRISQVSDTRVKLFWGAIGGALLLLFIKPIWHNSSKLLKALIN